MIVHEIFESNQGEGVHLGKRCVFVRFAECNLKCSFCDTPTKYDECVGDLSIDQILTEIGRYPSKRVVLTGGEPLFNLPKVVGNLLIALYKKDYFIQIETNGTQPLCEEGQIEMYFDDFVSRRMFEDRLWISCSPKAETDYTIHPSLLRYLSEVKFVVTPDLTMEHINKVFFTGAGRGLTIWLQPCYPTSTGATEDDYRISVARAIEFTRIDPQLRLGVQAHKMWGIR